ncbi:hypothetical protein [Deinococcus cellulosilyticus]|uniref:Uncharacterized protein n=1 Tax=Deinococcus cellulosilyticus (strain DSM 18568 / NBRC 106333 / KACC 11606 / 5516J-15) TaxID=1223518 RepID=A0A511MXP7_DEIC1|nr:hypothetical protein [Deinococcus cellulosilyticus]GEM45330.1 hypothetical protein DC3_09650 [Deinococcus cellulosilyticus NBRC 106333 = KACC 11606]
MSHPDTKEWHGVAESFSSTYIQKCLAAMEDTLQEQADEIAKERKAKLLQQLAIHAPACPRDWRDPFKPKDPLLFQAWVYFAYPMEEQDLNCMYAVLGELPHDLTTTAKEKALERNDLHALVQHLPLYERVTGEYLHVLSVHDQEVKAYAGELTLEARRQANWSACHARALMDALDRVGDL